MDLRAVPPTDVRREQRGIAAVVGVFTLIAALASIDLVGDLREGTTLCHALVEGTIVLAGALGVALLLRRLHALRHREQQAREQAGELTRDLARAQADGARWRSEARDLLAGLGALIDRQFTRWDLTAAERDVALLLLKGLSHKEVAAARGVGEATVRQQATAIYKKAGVGGRHDLSAFFLEDLLAPRDGPGR